LIIVVTSLWVEHLPAAVVAGDAEVLLLIERDQLMGRGNCRLWSQDRRLAALAQEQGLAGLA
jgi:hypothetical protein